MVSDKVSEASETVELGGENKRIALLIAALALALALTEVAGDDAKTEAQMRNVESANLWAFFQARTIRQTVLGAEADRAVVDAAGMADPAARAALEQQVQRWRGTIARWESEPDTREGRRELMTRAKEVEADRDRAMKEDGRYDAGAGAWLTDTDGSTRAYRSTDNFVHPSLAERTPQSVIDAVRDAADRERLISTIHDYCAWFRDEIGGQFLALSQVGAALAPEAGVAPRSLEAVR